MNKTQAFSGRIASSGLSISRHLEMKDLRKTLKPKLHTEMFINSSMKNQTENVFNERVMKP